MPTNFVTSVYPTPQEPPLEPDLTNTTGIAVSGGGSRSLTCAIGQYRALAYLGLLDKVGVISSVSGGTWASASFVYLPSQFADDDFLGTPTPDPGSLTVSALGTLSPNNLGNAPTRMDWNSVIEVLYHLKSKYSYPDKELWQGLIGERIFQLWNLWEVDGNGQPLCYYSGTADDVAHSITPNNPQLGAGQFTLQQRKRPLLIMNSSIFANQDMRGSRLLPFESSPFGIGVRGTFPPKVTGDFEIGGGLIQPFAMGSSVASISSDLSITVTPPSRPFSIVDMAGISSAAFAQTVQEKLPGFDSLEPKYQYWPVADPVAQTANYFWFADGGSLENTGICSLLARGVPRIISFVNTEVPLLTKPLDKGGSVTIDSSVQLLFGTDPDAPTVSLQDSYVASAPNATPDEIQVFEKARYYELMQGLAIANVQNHGPAMFKQTLTVLPNPTFDIAGGYDVEILWVYNTAVQNWIDLLSPDVQSIVNGLRHFPNYETMGQLGLSATEVNALAELSFWNLTSNADLVKSMFA